jgi:hypothetical protein
MQFVRISRIIMNEHKLHKLLFILRPAVLGPAQANLREENAETAIRLFRNTINLGVTYVFPS